MRIVFVKHSQIAADPTHRLDAEYWVAKQEEDPQPEPYEKPDYDAWEDEQVFQDHEGQEER